MFIKPTSSKTKNGYNVMHYLEDGIIAKRTNATGQVIDRDFLDERRAIAGDFELTKEAIANCEELTNNATSYYHISYSFKEDLEDKTLEEIEGEAEAFFLTGYDKSEYTYYTELHDPKENAKFKRLVEKRADDTEVYQYFSEAEAEQFKVDNPELADSVTKRTKHLHMVIVKHNNLTNTQLKITDRDERAAIDSFQEYINIKYGLKSIKDNQSQITTKQFTAVKEIKANNTFLSDFSKEESEQLKNGQFKISLENEVKQAIRDDKINSYEDTIEFIKNHKNIIFVDVPESRTTPTIVVKQTENGKNVNLYKGVFSPEFYQNLEVTFDKNERLIAGKNIHEYKAEVDKYLERRREEVSKRYDGARLKVMQSELIEKALEAKYTQTIEETNHEKIISQLRAKQNVFLTGGAGVGKSYTTMKVIEDFEKRNESVIRLGSTGIAAVNIEGQTLHSFFNVGIKENLDELKRYDEEMINAKGYRKKIDSMNHKIANAHLIVIDEISMVSDKQMEMINYRLKEANFTGQIMIAGDFSQLPPVSKTNDAKYAFESDAWKDLNIQTHELTVIKRSDNVEFAKTLNRLRYGKLSDEDIRDIEKMEHNKVDETQATYIYSTNAQARERNDYKLSQIDAQTEQYKTMITDSRGERIAQDNETLEMYEDISIDSSLEIKNGAEVILVSNNQEIGYANGDKGIYKGMDENQNMIIHLHRTKEDVLVAQKKFDVEFEEKKYTATNYPVKLGYAITTHKSQGMSIEHLVIDPNKIFENGQFYVALSRAKNPETCRIEKFYAPEPKPKKGEKPADEKERKKGDLRNAVKTNEKVLDFYHSDIRTDEQKKLHADIKERRKRRSEENLKNLKKEKNVIETVKNVTQDDTKRAEVSQEERFSKKYTLNEKDLLNVGKYTNQAKAKEAYSPEQRKAAIQQSSDRDAQRHAQTANRDDLRVLPLSKLVSDTRTTEMLLQVDELPQLDKTELQRSNHPMRRADVSDSSSSEPRLKDDIKQHSKDKVMTKDEQQKADEKAALEKKAQEKKAIEKAKMDEVKKVQKTIQEQKTSQNQQAKKKEDEKRAKQAEQIAKMKQTDKNKQSHQEQKEEVKEAGRGTNSKQNAQNAKVEKRAKQAEHNPSAKNMEAKMQIDEYKKVARAADKIKLEEIKKVQEKMKEETEKKQSQEKKEEKTESKSQKRGE